jgi:hypothetical protein
MKDFQEIQFLKRGFKENEFNPTIFWLGIYLLSLSAHSVLLSFSGDQEFSL